MHLAYTKPPTKYMEVFIISLVDIFINRYQTHVIYLGQDWRVWRNGGWVAGNDAECTTYIVKLLRDLERGELTQSERAVIQELKDNTDVVVKLLKTRTELRVSQEEKDYRRKYYRKYARWLTELPAPEGEVKRTAPDEEEEEEFDFLNDLEMDPSSEYANLGMHIDY